MKKKTEPSGLDYLRQLPLGIRDRALYNISIRHKQNSWQVLLQKYCSISDFINSSMIWADTREGREFWSCLHDTNSKNALAKYKDHLKTVPVCKA
jgi:hypothetical protein